ncbi:hypothetical protein M758_9G173000 [Ceratodon purpureus]|uniref:Uncharacterized protein n=1 Tax=Ceratodon purpureus TaxID=3225 RepID=A0A8T0GR18_CERPU|nr:hypothetical protein KC19_9G116700 [Ceratodon purpureus]KAG0606847.1 hypothetical protein M758_9G173000 [Ceratodon purpureus]
MLGRTLVHTLPFLSLILVSMNLHCKRIVTFPDNLVHENNPSGQLMTLST